MQATLVAFYGEKPRPLAELITFSQQILQTRLGNAFEPFKLEQVHGTIVGLEGEPCGHKILNRNFARIRHQARLMDLNPLMKFLRTTSRLPIRVRIGNYSKDRVYPFSSRGKHPYFRSFCISGQSALIVGWPIQKGKYEQSLYSLRREMEQFNVLYRYHETPDSGDNDFFLAIGQVDGNSVSEHLARLTEEELQSFLAERLPVEVSIDLSHIYIVLYTDRRLTRETSRWFPLTNGLDGKQLQDLLCSESSGGQFQKASF